MKDFNSPKYDDGSDPYIKWGRDLLAAKGIDYKSSGSLGSGMLFIWPAVQAFQIAGQLDGGLTRVNLILALRGMDMSSPNHLTGARFNMNGNKDSYFTEASEFAKYDSSKQQWIQQGDLIELSGKSTNCAWDQTIGNCRAG